MHRSLCLVHETLTFPIYKAVFATHSIELRKQNIAYTSTAHHVTYNGYVVLNMKHKKLKHFNRINTVLL